MQYGAQYPVAIPSRFRDKLKAQEQEFFEDSRHEILHIMVRWVSAGIALKTMPLNFLLTES